jgi:hypothetical protein
MYAFCGGRETHVLKNGDLLKKERILFFFFVCAFAFSFFWVTYRFWNRTLLMSPAGKLAAAAVCH